MRKKESIKPAMIELFKAEALSLMGTTNGQRRMFRIAATRGRDQEPAGPMAGARTRAC
ncbi:MULTISPECIES: hypothetical protein [Pseudomonas]|uniref:hypothetical protein n=1 Tax=Pseudomonas TaxID=286 RepID=UPI000A8900C1|nr:MULTISPECIES: hypothetical protein [Pseudomonas]